MHTCNEKLYEFVLGMTGGLKVNRSRVAQIKERLSIHRYENTAAAQTQRVRFTDGRVAGLCIQATRLNSVSAQVKSSESPERIQCS